MILNIKKQLKTDNPCLNLYDKLEQYSSNEDDFLKTIASITIKKEQAALKTLINEVGTRKDKSEITQTDLQLSKLEVNQGIQNATLNKRGNNYILSQKKIQSMGKQELEQLIIKNVHLNEEIKIEAFKDIKDVAKVSLIKEHLSELKQNVANLHEHITKEIASELILQIKDINDENIVPLIKDHFDELSQEQDFTNKISKEIALKLFTLKAEKDGNSPNSGLINLFERSNVYFFEEKFKDLMQNAAMEAAKKAEYSNNIYNEEDSKNIYNEDDVITHYFFKGLLGQKDDFSKALLERFITTSENLDGAAQILLEKNELNNVFSIVADENKRIADDIRLVIIEDIKKNQENNENVNNNPEIPNNSERVTLREKYKSVVYICDRIILKLGEHLLSENKDNSKKYLEVSMKVILPKTLEKRGLLKFLEALVLIDNNTSYKSYFEKKVKDILSPQRFKQYSGNESQNLINKLFKFFPVEKIGYERNIRLLNLFNQEDKINFLNSYGETFTGRDLDEMNENTKLYEGLLGFKDLEPSIKSYFKDKLMGDNLSPTVFNRSPLPLDVKLSIILKNENYPFNNETLIKHISKQKYDSRHDRAVNNWRDETNLLEKKAKQNLVKKVKINSQNKEDKQNLVNEVKVNSQGNDESELTKYTDQLLKSVNIRHAMTNVIQDKIKSIGAKNISLKNLFNIFNDKDLKLGSRELTRGHVIDILRNYINMTNRVGLRIDVSFQEVQDINNKKFYDALERKEIFNKFLNNFNDYQKSNTSLPEVIKKGIDENLHPIEILKNINGGQNLDRNNIKQIMSYLKEKNVIDEFKQSLVYALSTSPEEINNTHILMLQYRRNRLKTVFSDDFGTETTSFKQLKNIFYKTSFIEKLNIDTEYKKQLKTDNPCLNLYDKLEQYSSNEDDFLKTIASITKEKEQETLHKLINEVGKRKDKSEITPTDLNLSKITEDQDILNACLVPIAESERNYFVDKNGPYSIVSKKNLKAMNEQAIEQLIIKNVHLNEEIKSEAFQNLPANQQAKLYLNKNITSNVSQDVLNECLQFIGKELEKEKYKKEILINLTEATQVIDNKYRDLVPLIDMIQYYSE